MITLGLNIDEGGKLRCDGRFHNAGHNTRNQGIYLIT